MARDPGKEAVLAEQRPEVRILRQQPQQLQIADPNDPTLFAQAIDRIAGSGE